MQSLYTDREGKLNIDKLIKLLLNSNLKYMHKGHTIYIKLNQSEFEN